MAKNTIRVYPDGNVWVVKRDGTTRASAIKNTKQEALDAARDIAINHRLSVAIHGKDGRIQKIVRPEDREAQDEGCFITSACVKYYGLEDDCSQLQTLRNYRDSYLANTPEGKSLIQQYYKLAPKIVGKLESDKNKKRIFKEIFYKIESACTEIKNNKLDLATVIYKDTVIELLKRYKIK